MREQPKKKTRVRIKGVNVKHNKDGSVTETPEEFDATVEERVEGTERSFQVVKEIER